LRWPPVERLEPRPEGRGDPRLNNNNNLY
jgi:hypothetical protein